MKILYDEAYYERGIETGTSCYSNYRWMPELTIPMAQTMIEYLGIRREESILDFGCAKGYLVKAFRLLHREAFGYDISSYAIRSAPKDVRKYLLRDYREKNYDWVISKDVFEHISYEEIGELVRNISRVAKKMFVIVPLGQKGKYVIPAYELDLTHIIREDLEWWAECFKNNGFSVDEGTYQVKYIKENWSKWKKGNGFFVLHSTDDEKVKECSIFDCKSRE